MARRRVTRKRRSRRKYTMGPAYAKRKAPFVSRSYGTLLYKPLGGLPKVQLVKLPYCETIKCALSANVTANCVYNLNSLFDPQNTLTGVYSSFTGINNSNTQPLYRDQWATMYDQYRVEGCKYDIRAYVGDDSGTVIANMRVVVYPSDTSYGGENIMVTAERPYSRYMVVTSGAAQGRRIKAYIPTAVSCSTTKKELHASKDFIATMGNNPARVGLLNIIAAQIGNTNFANVSLYLDVRLIYYVMLINRIDVSGS